ncbi:MAG TPA: alpha-glucosidase/alpha-galactosidase [Planctomycetes bacterium]|nr:alpha-glucosidase/alpha-galactosidase [Planctomycetota bacterium]
MITVAMIGAGSVVFSKNLTGDILSVPEFKDARIVYMDIDKERLDTAVALCRKQAAAMGCTPTIVGTMDRREALQGADFVINMVQIGGFDSTLVDFEIPRKFGLEFTIADTTGPGGLFRALRTFPMLSGLVRDMEQLCPRGILLNYSNPMSMNMQTVFRTSGIRAVGLCHSVQGTFNQLMGYLGEDPAQVAFTCAGINHMAFYLAMEKGGVDLYPRLFAAMEDAKIYGTNKVRFELMRRLGRFITESSEHNAEYNPWFIPHGREMVARYDVPMDEYLRRCDGIVDEFERLKVFAAGPEPIKDVCKTHEYASQIMQAVVTGAPAVIYGNLVNGGTISNLPRTAIVEAPTLVDRTGLHHAQVGELPPQLVAYMMPHVSQHELFIRAAQEGRRDHVYQACMFDPLAGATLRTDQIVEMCDEMIAAYGDELPELKAKTLVPTSGKRFPKVDARVLRASWDKVQASAGSHHIKDWQVLGAFPGKAGQTTIATRTPFDALVAKDGTIDLKASVGGVKWKAVKAGKHGFVDLAGVYGPQNWCVCWGYAEVESVHAREVVVSCGSDDGIKLWLNGKVVHEHETGRGYSPEADKVTVQLKAGVNRILVKISQHTGGYGFGVSIPPANF